MAPILVELFPVAGKDHATSSSSSTQADAVSTQRTEHTLSTAIRTRASSTTPCLELTTSAHRYGGDKGKRKEDREIEEEGGVATYSRDSYWPPLQDEATKRQPVSGAKDLYLIQEATVRSSRQSPHT
uniref:Uncharacterized protein n=1 Tax=Oryza meridionalis TaxID=40149 RepID=A0A0E0CAT5_9ORYZ